jgi:hypothetical protein
LSLFLHFRQAVGGFTEFLDCIARVPVFRPRATRFRLANKKPPAASSTSSGRPR